MDFIDQLQTLASRIQKMKHDVQTEEATKNAFVLPFINALGYDIFNPREVVPEFTADIGIKKGEKVDYAIMRDEKPIILFECKKAGTKLDITVASQLYRYFNTCEARIAVVTDGVMYQFYSDLEDKNKMDTKPFMEFDFLDIQEALVPELKKLTKTSFDLDAAIAAAEELKYMREIRNILTAEFESPTDELLRVIIPRVHSGSITQRIRDQFRDIVRRALHQFVADSVNDRIKSALTNDVQKAPDLRPEDPERSAVEDGAAMKTELTVEEHEAYLIVKSILRDAIDLERISHRDTMSYCGVLLDDTNRQPICRFHFNRPQKYIGLFDAAKKEERFALSGLNDIYKFASRLKQTADQYGDGGATSQSGHPESSDTDIPFVAVGPSVFGEVPSANLTTP